MDTQPPPLPALRVSNSGPNPFQLNDEDIYAMAGPLSAAEMEAVRAVLNGVRKRLHDVDMRNGMVHAEGCWSWGPAHYQCAYNKIIEMGRERPAMSMEEIVRIALDLKLEIEDVRAVVRRTESYHNLGASV